MVDAVKNFFKGYVCFKGRTGRKDFWLAVLGLFIIEFVIGFILGLLGTSDKTITIVSDIISLAIFLPGIAIQVRRLHDINKSAWWILLALTGIGAIVLIVFYCLAPVEENNNYPKELC